MRVFKGQFWCWKVRCQAAQPGTIRWSCALQGTILMQPGFLKGHLGCGQQIHTAGSARLSECSLEVSPPNKEVSLMYVQDDLSPLCSPLNAVLSLFLTCTSQEISTKKWLWSYLFAAKIQCIPHHDLMIPSIYTMAFANGIRGPRVVDRFHFSTIEITLSFWNSISACCLGISLMVWRYVEEVSLAVGTIRQLDVPPITSWNVSECEHPPGVRKWDHFLEHLECEHVRGEGESSKLKPYLLQAWLIALAHKKKTSWKMIHHLRTCLVD